MFLVRNVGRLLSKDEIIGAVWPGVFVTDDSLVQCIKELRRVLGDDGDRLIKTVPRRGYRLDAPLPAQGSAVPPPEVPAARSTRAAESVGDAGWSRRSLARWTVGLAASLLLTTLAAVGIWRLAASPAAAPGLTRPAIAVLPFTSSTAEANYFADGVTEDITNALGRFSTLLVMSRNAVASYRGKTVPPQRVGKELAVRYLLEGKRAAARRRIARHGRAHGRGSRPNSLVRPLR
jgi:hypothetical protein